METQACELFPCVACGAVVRGDDPEFDSVMRFSARMDGYVCDRCSDAASESLIYAEHADETQT